MGMDVAILLVLFLAFIGFLLLPSYLARQRGPEEKSLTPLFEELCAVRRDFASASSPGRNMFLWRVSLYPEFLVLALFNRAIIPYREIDRVEIERYPDRQEVWIYRRLDAGGDLITVASKKAEQLVQVLSSAGVRYVAAAPRAAKQF